MCSFQKFQSPQIVQIFFAVTHIGSMNEFRKKKIQASFRDPVERGFAKGRVKIFIG